MVEVKLSNLLNGFHLTELMEYDTDLLSMEPDYRSLAAGSSLNIRYQFFIHDKEYQIYFDKISLKLMINDPTYNKWIKEYQLSPNPTSFHFAFGLVDENGSLVEDLTGTGDAPLVFTMAYRSVIKFLKEIDEEVPILFFASYFKEPTRVKLYDRFSSLFAIHLDRKLVTHNSKRWEAKIYAMIDTN